LQTVFWNSSRAVYACMLPVRNRIQSKQWSRKYNRLYNDSWPAAWDSLQFGDETLADDEPSGERDRK